MVKVIYKNGHKIHVSHYVIDRHILKQQNIDGHLICYRDDKLLIILLSKDADESEVLNFIFKD